MWAKLLCVLAVSDALRINAGENNVQEKSADQEESASVLLTRGAGSAEPQHTFGVKIEHPSGKDLQGRVLEQREHHQFGEQPPTVDQTGIQHEFHPSPTIPASVGGAWKGIDRFREHKDQQTLNQDLSQHQLLGQVLQGLGQVNQILGKNYQGIEQVNQIFGQDHQDYQKLKSFTNNDRELYVTGEKKIEEHNNQVDTIKEVAFEKTVVDVNNNLIENKDVTNYKLISEFKPIEEVNFSNLPKPSEQIEVKNEGVNTITVSKEVPVPYAVEVEKKVPFQVEVPVDRPYHVARPKPYPVYLEKKVPYTVKEYVPQPYTVYKRVPYTVKMHVNKPYPIHVPKSYRVLVEKKVPYQVEKKVPYQVEKNVPYQVEKHVPYPVRVYVDKPYPIHVPVLRNKPYTVEKKVPFPVQVSLERPYPLPVPKPYKVYVEKKVPHSAHEPVYRQPEVEGSGQPVSFPEDQGDIQELWSHHRHSGGPTKWREHVPYLAQGATYHFTHEQDQQEVEGSRQSGTTDQGTTYELQRHHQQPEWRENVPYPAQGTMYHSHELGQHDEGSKKSGSTDLGAIERNRHHPQSREHVTYPVQAPMYHQHELGQQEVEGSRRPGSSDQGDIQRHQQHPQWKEHLPYPVHVPMNHPHELGQKEVEGSRQPGSSDQGAIQRHQQHPQWKEHLPYPVHVPMYHPHELGQQEVLGSGQPSGTATFEFQRLRVKHPQWKERVPYAVHMPTYYQHELVGESGLEVTTDQRTMLEAERHHPSQWREHAPRYS